MCKIRNICLHPAVFEKMHNLRFLDFYMSNPQGHSNVNISEGLESLPDELQFLHWDRYPLKSLPPRFYPDNLVVFKMPYCELKQLWDDSQV